MKKIILDADFNAFLFDGTHVQSMGKAEKITDLWQGIIFSIGNDLYLKKNEEYVLLAEKAEFLSFGSANPYAEKQFEMVSGECLYVEAETPGILRLPNIPQYAPLYAKDIDNLKDKAFVVNTKDDKYKVYLFNGEEVLLSDAEALFCCGTLLWNGHGYVLQDEQFTRQTWKLIRQTNSYLLFMLKGVLFVFGTDGTYRALGALEETVSTPNGDILVTREGKSTFCYYPGNETVQCIVRVDDDQYYRITPDGSVYYSYTFRMSYYDSDTHIEEVYQFQDGSYVRTAHDEY